MKKYYLVLALVAIASLAHANTCVVLNPVALHNSSYGCDLASSLGVNSSQQVTGCAFNFNSCSATSWGGGLLYCKIGGITIGTLTKTAASWSCTLDTKSLETLNTCISSSSKCDFVVSCSGGWNLGDCTAKYDCNPKPRAVPDVAATAALLSLGLAGIPMLRRKLA